MAEHAKYPIVCFRVSPELLERLNKLAESEERKLADTVRRLVVKALGKGKK